MSVTIELEADELALISMKVNADLLCYIGHAATDGLFDREKAAMERLKSLSDKLKAAEA